MGVDNIYIFLMPFLIIIALSAFLAKRKMDLYEISKTVERANSSADEKRKPVSDRIQKIVFEQDVGIRVLEEIVFSDTADLFSRGYFFSYGKDAKRARALSILQFILRRALSEATEDDRFFEISDRIISLLDQASREIELLHARQPFDDLDDPEKSLLVDLMEEIPEDRSIPRQKAHQLADVIQLKYQDIKNLQAKNAQSAKWTRWGTAGTVFFGLLSLALSIYSL